MAIAVLHKICVNDLIFFLVDIYLAVPFAVRGITEHERIENTANRVGNASNPKLLIIVN